MPKSALGFIRKLLRTTLFVVLGILSLLLLLSVYSRYAMEPAISHPVADSGCRQYAAVRRPDSTTLTALANDYGRAKIIPEPYRPSILLALSHYPELRDTAIEFVIEKSFTPLESRPIISTVFKAREERRYQVIINPAVVMGMEFALFDRLSFEARAGAIGHELGHTLYYQDKSAWQLLQVALAYPWSEFRRQFERGADLSAIHHCLGPHLLHWSSELRPGGDAQWEGLGGYYLSPVEIQSFINQK